MELKDFVKNNNVNYFLTAGRISESFLLEIESIVGVKIGEQLKDYILHYGFLSYEYIDLFGVNNVQKTHSDMIHWTLFLHKISEKTKGLIAIEECDGGYYLVNSEDMVYRFIPGSKKLLATNMKLNEYILDRFLSV